MSDEESEKTCGSSCEETLVILETFDASMILKETLDQQLIFSKSFHDELEMF